MSDAHTPGTGAGAPDAGNGGVPPERSGQPEHSAERSGSPEPSTGRPEPSTGRPAASARLPESSTGGPPPNTPGAAAGDPTPSAHDSPAHAPSAHISSANAPAEASADGGYRQHLLSAEELGDMVTRWRNIQAEFVDEPKTAVAEADALVSDLMRRLTEVLASERAALESRLTGAGELSTEDLRQGLRSYRSFFERLLAT